jgi:hypothetical protein
MVFEVTDVSASEPAKASWAAYQSGPTRAAATASCVQLCGRRDGRGGGPPSSGSVVEASSGGSDSHREAGAWAAAGAGAGRAAAAARRRAPPRASHCLAATIGRYTMNMEVHM